MVVLLVDDDFEAEFMGTLDEPDQTPRAAVCLPFHCTGARLIVAPPGRTTGDIDRHQFDGRDAFLYEPGQMRERRLEITGSSERADVQFIDDPFAGFQRLRAMRVK